MINALPELSMLLIATFLVGATMIDLLTHRIPNVLVAGFLGVALILHVSVEGAGGLVSAGGGLAVGLLCMLPFYVLGGMAAGDVKLVAAAGAYFGPIAAIDLVLMTFLWGGVFAGAVIVMRLVRINVPSIAIPLPPADVRFPFAGAICAGAVTAAVLQLLNINLITG